MPKRLFHSFLTVLAAILMTFSVLNASADEPAVNYLRDIKPLLRERCFACHGALKQESSLRLDAVNLMRQGGDGGPVLVPGKIDESAIVERIEADEFGGRMPQGEQGQCILGWKSGGVSVGDGHPLSFASPELPRFPSMWSQAESGRDETDRPGRAANLPFPVAL